jgi:PAS domain S-box-containing protein
VKRWIPDLRSLSAQMILSFVALVLLTAAAAGLPAIWLIRDQLGREAWAQVTQGSLTAQALYEAKLNELESLATLTAQRPTLRGLLAEGEGDPLSAYLHTLQEGSGLDLVLICDSGRVIAEAGVAIPDQLCAEEGYLGFYTAPADPLSHVWLLAAHPLDGEAKESAGAVIVGMAMNDGFATQMSAQTGLEHTLLLNGQPVASSSPDHRELLRSTLENAPQDTFDVDGHPYYAAYVPLDGAGLRAEIALEVSGIASTQRRLALTLAGSILVVAGVASLLGTYLARRIGRPLSRLADAAGIMSKGDLDSPLAIEPGVLEVGLVSQALEGARSDLKRTLAALRREKAWTDHLLEAIVEGIVTLDRAGHITFFSRGAERITGWPREAVIGQTCDHVFKPTETDESFSQLMPMPGRRRKIPVEMHDGREAILAVTGARLLSADEGDAQVVLVFRDVSEAEAVHRLLGRFLANVAHEFRTPLSALAASVELLMDQAPDLNAAELDELLAAVHLGVLGLQTLIDNLLESASIEAGHFRVHPRPSNLGEIIAAAIHTMQPLLDKHEQRLTVALPAAIPMVQADLRRTVQVLVNLLSNASKYGPDEAEIEVGATAEGAWVRVTVADSGPGVPPEYHKDLFRRFGQPAWGNDKAQVGAGLGLSVVKAVIEAHGGAVGVDGRSGGGSAFWFTLPRVGEP